jgi:hypothetical protein
MRYKGSVKALGTTRAELPIDEVSELDPKGRALGLVVLTAILTSDLIHLDSYKRLVRLSWLSRG